MKIKNNILKPALIAVSISFAAITSPAQAGLKDELNSMFSEMSNVSAPGVHESQRRGVVFGGRVSTKNRIINQSVVSFVPPSIKSGCGGIDMFGGSFSFINSEQLVQLMRAVAQNAIGYAFQLALDGVCAPCSKYISILQEAIAKMNQYLGNSCQLAQGLVDGGLKAVTESFRKDEQNTAAKSGTFKDHMEALVSEAGSSLKRDKPTEYAKLIGNVTWNELQKNRVGSWFRHGDEDLMEAMLSIAGSVIVGDLIDDPNPSPGSSGEKTNKITPLLGNVLTVQELVFGSHSGRTVLMYDCSANRTTCAGNDGATPPHTKQVANFIGLEKRIKDMLLGSSTGPTTVGLISKYATENGQSNNRFSEAEKAFLSSLPNGIGGMVRNLSANSEASARQFVEENSALIAIDMSYQLASELLRAVSTAVISSNSAFAKEASELFEKSSRNLQHEFEVLASRHGKLSSVMDRYARHIELTRKQRYTFSLLTNQK